MNETIMRIMVTVFYNPGLTGRNISRMLSCDGYNIIRREVNQILYSHSQFFWREVDQNLKPSWYLHDDVKVKLNSAIQTLNSNAQANIDMADVKHTLIGYAYPEFLELYPWQKKALDKWSASGYVGVIEAVTGTGKTRVALAAIEEHCRKGWKVLIIVPTIDLQDQWYKVIQSDLIAPSGISIKVGRLGNGYRHSFGHYEVLIATSSSACNYPLHNGDYNGLLIADECHRYGADKWSRSLDKKFTRRLGLTATYERDDGGIESYLDPYFKSVSYRLGYDEALSDGVIANFKIAFIGVDFNNDEREVYKKHNNNCIKYRTALINNFGVTAEPFGEFMKEVTHISKGGEGQATEFARYYLNSFNKRRKLLSNCDHKKAGLAKLAPAIEKADRVILFTQTKDAARSMVAVLQSIGFKAEMLDSTMNRDERRRVLIGFEDGRNEIVAAPRLLDEGIDVPAADLAIVVASSRNKRQMIQRMGRVLRKKSDGRIARIAIFYIKGTSEDPEHGAHETYIDLIRDSADDVKVFNISEKETICDYLNDWNN